MTNEQLTIISEAVDEAIAYIYDNMDAICDEDYYEETQEVLRKVEQAHDILQSMKNGAAS